MITCPSNIAAFVADKLARIGYTPSTHTVSRRTLRANRHLTILLQRQRSSKITNWLKYIPSANRCNDVIRICSRMPPACVPRTWDYVTVGSALGRTRGDDGAERSGPAGRAGRGMHEAKRFQGRRSVFVLLDRGRAASCSLCTTFRFSFSTFVEDMERRHALSVLWNARLDKTSTATNPPSERSRVVRRAVAEESVARRNFVSAVRRIVRYRVAIRW